MTDSKHQLEILRLAEQDGIDPAKMSRAQYTRYAIKARSIVEVAKDGGRAIRSRVNTTISLIVVSDKIADDNLLVCQGCDKFKMIGGEPACTECTCAGKWLRSKLKDGTESCPLPEPKWDNRNKPREPIVSFGDSSGRKG